MAIFEQNTAAMSGKLSYSFVLLLCSAYALVSFAQPSATPMKTGDIAESELSVKWNKCDFEGMVSAAYWNPKHQLLLVETIDEMTKKGNPISGSLWGQRVTDGKKLWRVEFEQSVDSYQIYDDHLLIEGEKLTEWCDILTSEPLWLSKTRLLHVDPSKNYAVGFNKIAAGKTGQRASALSLDDGKPIWKTGVPYGEEYHEVQIYGDSVMFVLAPNGLHRVGFTEGDTWHYKLKTSKGDGVAVGVAVGMGFAFGLLGAAFISATDFMVKGNLQSNMVVKGGFIYVADKKHIVKLGPTGEAVWKQDLPKEMASQSIVNLHKGVVTVVNTSLAYDNYGNPKRSGTPMIAAFDEYDGAQRFLKPVECGDEAILDVLMEGNTCRLLTGTAVIRYNMSNGLWAYERKLPVEYVNRQASFASDDLFDFSDNRFFPVNSHPRFSHMVRLDDGQFLMLDEDDELIDRVSENQSCTKLDSFNNYHLLAGGEVIYLADGDLQLITTLPKGFNAFFTEHGFMVVAEDGVYDIRWEENPSLLAN
ncbi:MAG: hypothetical protein EA392_08475 [Cryomorphaceae bacterium]|nr:MAG: hypothetical protein EA392_08475 [Cryomorphaceae bacterium]